MVPIKGTWTPFKNFQDQLEHYRLWGLIPDKSKALRPVMVTDGYWGIPEPCDVVGYQGDKWAVIKLNDSCHCIHGEYLTELQPVAFQRLPFGMCFVEILSKYVVVDIETTGFDYNNDRIIEIAAVSYEYGKKVAEFTSLVNPDMLIPPEIINLTGITQEMVSQAPSLAEVERIFLDFIGNLPIIGHNAVTFDIPFLNRQLSVKLSNAVIDTLPMARKVFDRLPSHKLEYLNVVLQLGISASHRALHDVEATNALLWACLSPRRYENAVNKAYLDDRLCGTVSRKHDNKAKSKSHPVKGRFEKVDIKSIVPSCVCSSSSGPLFGKQIVFTGSLSIPREEAMQLAVDAGAILKSSVSSKTNYLVVGQQDITIVGMEGKSSKEEKAEMLNLSGKASINVICEKEFLDLVHNNNEFAETEQTTSSELTLTEDLVYAILKDSLSSVVSANNVDYERLKIKKGKSYSSVWYDTQMAFRICCRDSHHYFGVSNLYAVCAPDDIQPYITKDGRSDGFTNYEFIPDENGVALFSAFLSSALDMAIDSTSKEFDCCSRFEECSNAGRCINPNVAIATGCGYRRIMKKGHIFYGKNRNVD